MSAIPTTNPTQDLFFYVVHGDVPKILDALDSGAKPNTIAGISTVGISFAFNETMLEEDRKRAWGVVFDKLTHQQIQTPLSLATEFEQYDAVLALLERGANPNFADEHGITPLWVAAQRRQINIVRVLLLAGASVDGPDGEGQTPLFRAAANGDTEMVRLLLAAGADPNRVSSSGMTPLLLAARLGQDSDNALIRRRKLLRDQMEEEHVATERNRRDKASVREDSSARPIVLRSKQNQPVENYPAVVAELLLHGAEPNVVFPHGLLFRCSTTPLNEAALLGSEEITRLLLKHGAEINPEADNPLSSAVFSGNTNLIRLFLEQGVSVNSPTSNGSTPLMMAAASSKLETVVLLLENGADVSARHAEEGTTVLHKAAEFNNSEVIHTLVRHGAGLNSHDNKQQTPLIIAIKNGAIESIQILLAEGADIFAQDEAGSTAWNHAQAEPRSRRMLTRLQEESEKLVPDRVDNPFRLKSVREGLVEKLSSRLAEEEASRATIIELLRAAGADK